MPLSVLEAVASGLPIVSTAAGGIPCVVPHGETGLLVPPRDSTAFATAAIRLEDERDLAAARRRRPRRLRDVHVAGGASGWLTLYERISIGDQPRPAPVTAPLEPPASGAREKPWGRSRDELRVRTAQSLSASATASTSRGGPSGPRTCWNGHAGDRCTASRALSGLRAAAHHSRASDRGVDRGRVPTPVRPDHGAALVDRADRIVDGRFDLLGYRDLSCGSPVDWHLDPVTGERLPLVHWSRLARPDPRSSVDRKLVWELNRHSSSSRWARAYWLTGDERYAGAFAQQLSGWIESNPPGSASTGAAASRWRSGRSLGRGRSRSSETPSSSTPELFLPRVAADHLQAAHVASYPSTYSSPNTHLTGEALGLFYRRDTLAGAARGRAMEANGLQAFRRSVGRQVEDGVYFERSTAYHRYTIDFYDHFVVVAAAGGDDLEPVVPDRLRALLDHLLYVARPDGTIPLLGDDDGGRLLPLDERSYDDAHPTLAIGAALLDDPCTDRRRRAIRGDAVAAGSEAVRPTRSRRRRRPQPHAPSPPVASTSCVTPGRTRRASLRSTAASTAAATTTPTRSASTSAPSGRPVLVDPGRSATCAAKSAATRFARPPRTTRSSSTASRRRSRAGRSAG